MPAVQCLQCTLVSVAPHHLTAQGTAGFSDFVYSLSEKLRGSDHTAVRQRKEHLESEVHADLTAPVPGFTHGDGAIGGDVDEKLSEYVALYCYGLDFNTFQESVIGVPVSVDVSVYADTSASKESVSRLFVGDAFVLFDLATTRWRTFDSLLPVSEKQPVRPVYPVGYLLYRLTSHITPVVVFILVAKTTELFLEFVFIQKLPCRIVVVLYDCQCRVVYDPGNIYHITKVSEVIAIVQFYCQCPHDIIIAHFMALCITSFHLTAKARELSRRLICNRFHGLERRYEKRHRVLEVLTAALPLLLLKPLYMLGDKLVYSQIKTKLGSNFTCGISGGGSLSPMIDDFFNAIGINLVDGYGLTETAPVIGIRTWKKRRPGTMVPYGNVDIKIISLEDGHLCKVGEKGELHVKGEQVMKGYYKRPEFTAKVIDKDGYFNTGDLAVWTIDNEYNIVGRSKDTIVLSGGENLEPVPIEAALNESEYIEASVVVGQDQKYLGALIVPAVQAIEYYLKQNKIYYVSRDDIYTLPEVHSLIENEIRERVSSKTGFKSFEQIYKFALLRKSFEINNELSSKQEIKRFKIAQLYEKEIKEMFV